MLTGLILILIGFIIVRKKKTVKKWVKKHKFIAIFGVISFFTGFGMGVRMVGQNYVNHINSIHSVFGVVTLICLILTPLIGQTIFWAVKSSSLKKRIKFFRIFHRWLGRTTILLAIATLVLGLLKLFLVI
ncbi:MAG: hypothetical protein ACXABO_11845 [Promethearchaeota archaeon]|jgi:hypothetical protein